MFRGTLEAERMFRWYLDIRMIGTKPLLKVQHHELQAKIKQTRHVKTETGSNLNKHRI